MFEKNIDFNTNLSTSAPNSSVLSLLQYHHFALIIVSNCLHTMSCFALSQCLIESLAQS